MRDNESNKWLWWLTLLCCGALAIFFELKREWHNLAMYGIIHADAQGYYGYLVAAFLERSFDWEQVISSYSATYFGGGAADFTVMTDAGRVNKYYVGASLLMLPFFLLSCLAAWIMKVPVDGYSEPFHIGMMLGALFYVLVGLFFLGKYLRKKGIGWSSISWATLGGFAGTGLFYYTVMEPAMSHVYSFFLFSAFIYVADKSIVETTQKNLGLLATVLALIVLVRPSNAVIILSLPFIAGGWKPCMAFAKEVLTSTKVILPLAIAVAIVSFQPLMYWIQVGQPLVWSYSGEGFNFRNPQIINVLFSYKKGFFVYYPWAILASVGLVALFLRSKAAAVWLVAFLGVAIYIISSWWSWYYGCSFGMRALVEYLPFFILLMAYLIHALPVWGKVIVVVLSLAAIPLNLIQSYQYNKFILHWIDMNQERYWQIFLQTGKKYDGIFYREAKPELIPSEERIASRWEVSTDLEVVTVKWGTQGRTSELAHSGKHSSKINAENPYGATIGIPFSEMGVAGKKIVVATFMAWSEEELPALTLAYSFNQNERHYGHDYIGCGDQILEKNTWTAVRVVVELPSPELATDVWIVYPYTTGAHNIFVDEIRYEIITLKE